MSKKFKGLFILIILLIIVLCVCAYSNYKTRVVHLPKEINSMMIEYGEQTYSSDDSDFIKDFLETCNLESWKKGDKPEGDVVPELYITINNDYVLSFTPYEKEELAYCVVSNKNHITNLFYGGGYRFDISLYNNISRFATTKLDNT